jgi:hypothetical protein
MFFIAMVCFTTAEAWFVKDFASERTGNLATKDRTGHLIIKCNAKNADLLLNGRKMGMLMEKGISIEEGQHHIILKADGYENYSNSFEIKKSENKIISVVLNKLKEGFSQCPACNYKFKYPVGKRGLFGFGDAKPVERVKCPACGYEYNPARW